MASASAASQRAQLLELLAKALHAPPDALSHLPALVVGSPNTLAPPSANNDDRADALLEGCGMVLRARGDPDRAASLAALQRKLLSAGTAGSGMAAFRDKAALVELLVSLSPLAPSSGAAAASLMGANAALDDRGGGTEDSEDVDAALVTEQQLPPPPRQMNGTHPASATTSAGLAAVPSRPTPATAAAAPATTFGVLPDAAEAALLRDLMFVLQGIDGVLVRFGESPSSPTPRGGRDGRSFVSVDRIVCGEPLPRAAASLVEGISELGWLYRRITACLSRGTPGGSSGGGGGGGGVDGPDASWPRGTRGQRGGAVRRAMDAAVRAELDEYFRALAQLSARRGPSPWTLRRLSLWAEEHAPALRLLAAVTEASAHLHGGALASAVHSHTNACDPTVRCGLGVRLLGAVTAPLTAMALHWIGTGELPVGDGEEGDTGGDPLRGRGGGAAAPPWHGPEFFIVRSAPRSPSPSAGGSSGGWRQRLGDLPDVDDADVDPAAHSFSDEGGADSGEVLAYELWQRQLPAYLPTGLAASILEAGRTVAFVRAACGDGAWVAERVTSLVASIRDAYSCAAAAAPATPSSGGGSTPLFLLSASPSAGGGGWYFNPAEHGPVAVAMAEAHASLSALAAAAAPQSSLSPSSSSLPLSGGPHQTPSSVNSFALVDPVGLHVLEAAVAATLPLANARAVHALRVVHRLPTHLLALRRFVLLTQGDFVSVFLAGVAPELHKPATAVAAASHVLDGVLETAIRSSNATLEGTDVLARLGVRLLAPSPGDSGWGVLCLHYAVGAPLSAVVTPRAAAAYARLFTFLWRLRRVDHALGGLWSAQTTASHALHRLGHGGLDGLLHASHLLRADMSGFVTTLTAHLMTEGVLASGAELDAAVAAASSLRGLVGAHDAFIRALTRRMFLSASTRGVAAPLAAVLTEALAFAALQEGLLAAALGQVARQRAFEAGVARRSAEGGWGAGGWAVPNSCVCKFTSRGLVRCC